MKWVLIWATIIVAAILFGLTLAWGWNQFQITGSPFNMFGLCSSGWTDGNDVFRMGPGMMNFDDYRRRNGFEEGRLSSEEVLAAVEQYLTALGNPDLKPGEMMEFTENFYISVVEDSSGIHAFEILVDPQTGAVYPEPGPNMMWNLKYGHMNGMMGFRITQPQSEMPIDMSEAVNLAQTWLNENMPGMAIEEEGDQFYGYYTLHVIQNDRIYGMLSVNGYNGRVWYHNWHGNFISMKEMEE